MKIIQFIILVIMFTSCTNPGKVLYQELTPDEFSTRLAECPVAYLPLGTLEWHGDHLPLGSDGMQSLGVFKILAQEAGGIVMPMLFIGPDGYDTIINGREASSANRGIMKFSSCREALTGCRIQHSI